MYVHICVCGGVGVYIVYFPHSAPTDLAALLIALSSLQDSIFGLCCEAATLCRYWEHNLLQCAILTHNLWSGREEREGRERREEVGSSGKREGEREGGERGKSQWICHEPFTYLAGFKLSDPFKAGWPVLKQASWITTVHNYPDQFVTSMVSCPGVANSALYDAKCLNSIRVR